MADNGPSGDNSIEFQMQSVVNGYPSVVDPAFLQALTAAKAGGEATWTYFNGINQTSDFWGAVADGTIDFVDAHDPEGNPVVIASTGNVDMRILATYAGDATATGDTDGPVMLGTTTVTTGNTTTAAAQMLELAVRVASMPPYLKLSGDLFKQLLKPLYANTKMLLTKMAKNLQTASQVENPSIDPLAQAEEVVEEQSTVEQELTGPVVEEGLEYMSIDWTTVALDVAGMAPLVAIPMIIGFLGHDMYHSLMIQNLTTIDFTWNLEQLVHGKSALLPSDSLIPATQTQANVSGTPPSTQFSYQANYQFINSSNLGSIGYVLSLTPTTGGSFAYLVISVPWAGENAIWVGDAQGSPDAIYETYSAPNGNLTQTAAFGDFQITISINKLSGETGGTYFYTSLVVIEPIVG